MSNTGVDQNLTTCADAFRASPEVAGGVDAIVSALETARAHIEGPRGPVGGLRARFEDLLERGGAARGRAYAMKYIGSGLGRGPLVELSDGSVKYDMITGIGPNFFGHSDPDLVRTAIKAATSDLLMEGYLQSNEDAVRFTERLATEAGRNSNLANVFLCNSGSMANDAALKACFQMRRPADRVIVFNGCFMGRTLAMSQLGDNAAYRDGIPYRLGVDYVPFYDNAFARSLSAGDVSGQTRAIDASVSRLEEHFKRYPGQHASFTFEIVQGEGGYNTAPREFFVALMEACKAHGVSVWTDEIQSFGRTGEMFAFETLGLGEYIDVCTVGKMSQVCATIFTPEHNPKPGLLSGTFLGSAGGLQVGERILDRLRNGGFYGAEGSIAAHHAEFVRLVRAMAAKHPNWFPTTDRVPEIVGGLGGMVRFTPFGGVKKGVMGACKAIFEEGVLLLYCGHDPYHVRMLPPLAAMEVSDWPAIFEVVERGLAKAAANLGV